MSVLLLKVTKPFCNPLWWMQECVCGINFIFEIEVLCSIACWLRFELTLKVCINCISWMMTRCSEQHWGKFQNCLHHCHSHKSLTIGSEDEPQSYLYVTFPLSSSSPLKRALKIINDGFQCPIFFYGFFKTYRRSQENKYFLWCDKKLFSQHDGVDCLRTTTVHSQHRSQSLNKKSTCHINDFWSKHAEYMDEEKETTKTGPYRVRFRNKCEKLSKNEQKC